jgi:FkbM family methyltransferase
MIRGADVRPAPDPAGGKDAAMAAGLMKQDERRSSASRRASWYGAKKWLKHGLGIRAVNYPLTALLRLVADRHLLSRFPVNRTEVSGHVHGRSFALLAPMRCALAKELYWGDGELCDPSERFALALFAFLAVDAEVILDIGANTGIFSIVGAQANSQARVHAFEIVPDVFSLLFRNIVRNDLVNRVECHHYGIGEEGAIMTVPEAFSGSGLPTSVSSRMHFDSGISVPFRSLDAIGKLLPASTRVLVKIDVERTEDQVFGSAGEFVLQHRTEFLCEILPRANESAVNAFLNSHGYFLYKIGPGYLQQAEVVRADPGYRDWLFTFRTPEELKCLVPLRAA